MYNIVVVLRVIEYQLNACSSYRLLFNDTEILHTESIFLNQW